LFKPGKARQKCQNIFNNGENFKEGKNFRILTKAEYRVGDGLTKKCKTEREEQRLMNVKISLLMDYAICGTPI
jgi:hypothetical protein